MVKRGFPLLLSGTLALVAGCDSGSYDVVVRFEPRALAGEVARLEVSFVPGNCTSLDLAQPAPPGAITTAAASGETFMSFGDLEPGPYALHARGTSATCATVGAGCRDITLAGGGTGELVVVVRPIDALGCPDGVECVDGVCGGTGMDGGIDGGPRVDGGGMDARSVDATDRDAPGSDAGALDAGTDSGTDAGGCECMPSDVSACAAACGRLGTRSCTATCTWGACSVAADSSTVALYTFDSEPDTSTITDSVGSHDGTVVGGTVTWSPGPRGCGTAMETTGAVGVYGLIPSSPDWDIASGSFSVWALFDSTGTAMGLVSRDAADTLFPGHVDLSRSPAGILELRLQAGGVSHYRCSAAPIPTGRWVEIHARFGGADLELVVDGVPMPPTKTCGGTITTGIAGNDNPWAFGARTALSAEGSAEPIFDHLDGRIDQVRITRSRATPSAPRITSLVLVDASNDASLGPLADGDELVLSLLPSISVRATTDPGMVGSVVFGLDGDPRHQVETSPPYMLSGDFAGVTTPWSPTPGVHVITATPYIRGDGTGVAGPTITARVTVR